MWEIRSSGGKCQRIPYRNYKIIPVDDMRASVHSREMYDSPADAARRFPWGAVAGQNPRARGGKPADEFP